MKKKNIILIILLSFFITIDANALTNEQNALMETARAYYRKGKNIQYCTYRKSFSFTPEDATSQAEQFTVCSGFTNSSYKEALGMILPKTTANMTAAAYYNKTEADILLQLNKTEIPEHFTNTETSVTNFIKSLYTTYNLQVGDLIIMLSDSDGHVIMIEDVAESDAYIIESTGNYEKDSTKITKGLSYKDSGTIKRNTLSAHLKHFYNGGDYNYFTVYRPLANNNGTYNKYSCSLKESGLNAYKPENYNCTKESATYGLTASANSRMKYSNIDIDKTVSGSDKTIVDGSVVNPGDILIYSIVITNNSSSNYEPITVTENISPYVDAVTESGESITGDQVTFTVPALAPSASYTIKYIAKVKSGNYNNKYIESTGIVDGRIKTATIKNKIYDDKIDSSKLKEAYNSLKNTSSQTGIAFINEIYKTASSGVSFDLDGFDIGSLINTSPSTDYDSISLNKDNKFSKYVLNNYFGATYTKSSNGNVYLRYFQSDDTSVIAPNRANRIYKEHLKDGDVLIYRNSNDSKTNENGDYAYIYLDGSFYGINKLADGSNKNEFPASAYIVTTRAENTQNSYLNTLLGKDYYVILRPSMINDDSYIPMPDTNENSKYYLFIGGIIFIVFGGLIIVKTTRLKKI